MRLPEQEKLRRLPLRALVAYTTRCARRVQPLYVLPSSFQDREAHVHAVEDAILLAREFSGGGTVDVVRALAAAKKAEDAANAAKTVSTGAQAVYSAYAASYAAWAVHVAASDLSSSSRVSIQAFLKIDQVGKDQANKILAPNRAALTARCAHAAAASAGQATPAAVEQMLNDYNRLADLELGAFPELGNPIDPLEQDPLGDLWSDGTPKWYTIDHSHPFFDEIIQFFVSAISLQALLYPSLVDKAIRGSSPDDMMETPSGQALPLRFPDLRFETHLLELGCNEECVFSNAATVEYLLGNTGLPTQLFFAVRPAPSSLPDLAEFDGQLESHLGPSLDIVTRYLVGGAYERQKDHFSSRYRSVGTWPPELQFFRHMRNGCFHNNVFNIIPRRGGPQIDPSSPPRWHTYVMPSDAAIHGQKVIDGFFWLPHVLPFLHDMGKYV